jgi:hypothetical protein
LQTAAATISARLPDLAIVRVPYLGQVARRFGPDCREAGRAIRSLEPPLAAFLKALPRGTKVIAVTESVTTPVSAPIYPNRILRSLGLLSLTPAPGGGLDIDLNQSAAFALADHQLCHIYLNDLSQAATVAAAFSGPHGEGVATVAPGNRRAGLGMDHPRAGDVVLVAQPDHWFTADWWNRPSELPKSGVRGSGLAPFAPLVPIDPAHVKGSMGAPPPSDEYLGLVVSSCPDALGTSTEIAARDVARLVLKACTATTS